MAPQFTCLVSPVNIEYEDEDYEEGEETEAEEEASENNVEPKEPPRREDNSVHVDESEPDVDPAREEHPEAEEEEDEMDNEIIPKSEMTDPEVTTTTSPPAPVVDLCQLGNGGCDHNCRFVKEDHDPEGRVECSCFSGFNLNAEDGRTCHGESQF